jgi:hypothetical protein
MALSVSSSFAAPALMPDLRDWITAGQPEATASSDIYADPGVDDWPDETDREPAAFTINRRWAA